MVTAATAPRRDKPTSSIAVVGATSWGVTLAWLLARNHRQVVLVVRSEAEAESVRERRGIARLPECILPGNVETTTGLSGREVLGAILAVPAQSLRATAAGLNASTARVLSAAKGIELTSGRRMTQVVREELPGAQVAALSGPNLAHEVARGLPAAAVLASEDDASGRFWQTALASPAFRVYTSTDVVGVELAGALKNVVAIAAGAAVGLELGSNAVSAIVTRGLAEMTRLGVALGGDVATFIGLAGVGDLAATCFSPLSRNHRLGELLARGYTPDAALATIGETVEGASTAPVALRLAAAAGVELPITASVVAVLEGRADVKGAMTELLSRPLKPESTP